MDTPRKRVVIVQRVVVDYRAAFFRQLHDTLRSGGIDLFVAGGQPRTHERLTDDIRHVPSGIRCPNVYLPGALRWQKGIRGLSDAADMVVLEDAATGLHLYPLLWRMGTARCGGKQPLVAIWGHGPPPAVGGDHPRVGAFLRRRIANRASHWFAYTEASVSRIGACGVPRERITVVQNAIDTVALRRCAQSLGAADIARLRGELFRSDPQPPGQTITGVFCGRLVPYRNVPLLLSAVERIKRHLGAFRFVFVGDGPERESVQDFCRSRPWSVEVGEKRGMDRVRYLAMGDVWLNPGAVGLAVLDAFALGLPMFTSQRADHGPEIAYLRDGENGLIFPDRADAFADGVCAALRNRALMDRLSHGASVDGRRITLSNFVSRFREGIVRCLARKDLSDRTEKTEPL